MDYEAQKQGDTDMATRVSVQLQLSTAVLYCDQGAPKSTRKSNHVAVRAQPQLLFCCCSTTTSSTSFEPSLFPSSPNQLHRHCMKKTLSRGQAIVDGGDRELGPRSCRPAHDGKSISRRCRSLQTRHNQSHFADNSVVAPRECRDDAGMQWLGLGRRFQVSRAEV